MALQWRHRWRRTQPKKRVLRQRTLQLDWLHSKLLVPAQGTNSSRQVLLRCSLSQVVLFSLLSFVLVTPRAR